MTWAAVSSGNAGPIGDGDMTWTYDASSLGGHPRSLVVSKIIGTVRGHSLCAESPVLSNGVAAFAGRGAPLDWQKSWQFARHLNDAVR
jgi:hypothetical protein